MPTILALPVDEALVTQAQHQPSPRTLRTKRLEEDALTVVQAVDQLGAATIDFSDDPEPDRYVSGLRAALKRLNEEEILTQKRRNGYTLVAWRMRPEDAPRVQKRQEVGLRLGMMARARASQNGHGSATAQRGPRGATAGRAMTGTATSRQEQANRGRRRRSS